MSSFRVANVSPCGRSLRTGSQAHDKETERWCSCALGNPSCSWHQYVHQFPWTSSPIGMMPTGPEGCCTCRSFALQLWDKKFGEHAIAEQMISKFSLCPRGKTISSLKIACCKHILMKEKEQSGQSLYSCQGHAESLKIIIKCHRLSGLNTDINLHRVSEDQSLRSGCQHGGFCEASLPELQTTAWEDRVGGRERKSRRGDTQRWRQRE